MVLKKVQFSVCPNPGCKTPFESLIVIYDRSKNLSKKFYGCPYCFFKLDPTVTGSLKKIEEMVEVEELNYVTPSEDESVSNCPEYFGYLTDHITTSIIPRQCLDCEKLGNCMKKS